MCAAAGATELKKVAPGVFFRFADVARGQGNGGFIVCKDCVVAIEAPNAEAVAEMYDEAKKISDKPVKYLIITHGHWDHDGGLDAFLKKGVTVIVHNKLRTAYAEKKLEGTFIGVGDKLTLAGGGKTIELLTFGTSHSASDMFIYLPDEKVLFTGDTVVSMPACWLGESDIQNWIDTIGKLGKLSVKTVCPGHGQAGGTELLANQAAYLVHLRDEVAYQVSQGRTYEVALENVKLPEGEKWAMGDSLKDHVKAAYTQLTADPPETQLDATLRALVLIGDHYHPPAYIRPPLEQAFREIGMPAQFIYDVTKLNAKTLKGVRLLVVLRDGMVWPNPTKEKPEGDAQWWMTDEQEKAIADFVSNGGGYLALHNCTALRRIDGQQCLYRDVLGSSYAGHGAADEKFTVRVVKADHPVTAGVKDYQASDERHDPPLYGEGITVLTEAISGDKKSVNGYVRTYGKGRVCHLANGHNIEMLQEPNMQRMIKNAALWCCGIE